MTEITADKRAREHLDSLSRDQLAEAIANMRAMGFSEYSVASATRLSVEAVRQILAEKRTGG